jgi:hypothetical protein
MQRLLRALIEKCCGISFPDWRFFRFPLLTNPSLIHILLVFTENCMAKKPIQGKDFLIRNPDVVLREEDPDGALLFNPDTNQVLVLNTTGLFIWKHCDGYRNPPDILKAIKETFEEIPQAEVEANVKDFITQLQTKGFIGLSDSIK